MSLFLASLLFLNLQTDPWVVCHVTDTVRFAGVNNQRVVKRGDIIGPADSLSYSGSGARLILVNARGIFELPNRKMLPRQPMSRMLLVVRDHILPASKIGQMHTRSSGALLNLQAMQDHIASLSDEDVPNLLLVNDIRFCLHQQAFTKRDKQYFLLKYLYQGKPVTEKLPYIEPKQSGDPLYVSINKSLFVQRHVPLDTAAISDVQLYYQTADAMEPVLISPLRFTFAGRQTLSEELKIVVRQLGSNNTPHTEKAEEIRKLAADYLQYYYGWIDAEQLSGQFPELFK